MEDVSGQMLNGGQGVTGYVYKGITKTCGFAPVKINGWSLAFTQNNDEFLAGVRHIRSGMLMIGAVALILATVLIVLFASNLAKMIHSVVQGLEDSSGQVSAASSQTAASSQMLAESASEQAASIEEISASLEEITAMTRQNADNSSQADTFSQNAIDVVTQTGQMMAELNSAMQENRPRRGSGAYLGVECSS